MGKDTMLSVADASEFLGVLPRQVRNLITKGLLPAERIGGTYIIRRSDLARVPKVRKPGPKPKPRK
jgi:excisionase family DNA binding protein